MIDSIVQNEFKRMSVGYLRDVQGSGFAIAFAIMELARTLDRTNDLIEDYLQRGEASPHSNNDE